MSGALVWLIEGAALAWTPDHLTRNTTIDATDLALADLDGDGDLDIVSNDNRRDWITWYPQLAPFQFGPGEVLATVADTAAFALADLDGDGDLDVATQDSPSGGGDIGWVENTGGGVLAPWMQLHFGGGPTGVVPADTDGDGDLDLVTVLVLTDEVAVVPNLGGGLFGPLQGVATGPTDVIPVSADVDLDGDVDLLVGDSTGPGGTPPLELSWLLNDGTGTFSPGTWTGLSSTLGVGEAGACGDLDGDGLDDLVTSDTYGEQLLWFRGLGGGSFDTGTPIVAGPYGQFGPELADLDADGDLDLVFVENGFDDAVWWGENLGAGVLAPSVPVWEDESAARGFVTGDLDADGLVDVVSRIGGPSPLDGRTVALHNLGGGAFEAPLEVSGPISNPAGIGVCDLDQDGDEDLLVLDRADGELFWFPNDGGSFVAPIVVTTAFEDSAKMPSDVDGDGDLDLLVPTYDAGVQWMEGLGGGLFAAPAPLIADVDAVVVVAGDVDADGDADVVAYRYPYGPFTFVEGLGGGTFAAPLEFELDEGVYQLTLGDVDGDADLDLVGVRAWPEQSVGLWTFGAGGFSGMTVISPELPYIHQATLADLDGDGDLDLPFVMAAWDYYFDTPGGVGWLENLGGGVFDVVPQIVAEPVMDSAALVASDVDGDGDTDLLYTEYYDDRAWWSENLGGGAWAASELISADRTYAGGLAVVDLDGDSCREVVSLGSLAGVAVYRDETCVPLVAPPVETGDTGAAADTSDTGATTPGTDTDTDGVPEDTGSAPTGGADPAPEEERGCSCAVGSALPLGRAALGWPALGALVLLAARWTRLSGRPRAAGRSPRPRAP